MALPTSAVQNLSHRTRSGIILGITPSTGGPYRIEIQRSTVNSTASTVWTSVFLDPTSQSYRFTDYLPLSTRTFYYRMRHWGLGLTNSSFSPVINAKPAKLPEAFQSLPPRRNNLGNVEFIGGDIWLSSAKTAKVGTQVTTGTVTKSLRFGANNFIPVNNTLPYSHGVGTLVVGTAGTSSALRTQYPLARGLKITKFRARGRRNTTGQTLIVKLYTVSTAGTATTAATLTFTAGAQQTVESSALSITIGAANYLVGEAQLKATTATNQPSLVYTEFDYAQGTYVQTY